MAEMAENIEVQPMSKLGSLESKDTRESSEVFSHSSDSKATIVSQLKNVKSDGVSETREGSGVKQFIDGVVKELIISSGVSGSDGSSSDNEIIDDVETASSVDFPLKGETNGSVVSVLRKYIEGTEDAHAKNGSLSFSRAFFSPDNATNNGTMKVKYCKVPKTSKESNVMYPYKQLQQKQISYRGYPVQSPASLKNSKLTIQIIGSALGAPTQPLSQFPQQEVLGISKEGKYCGLPPLTLSDDQVAWNSGRAYLTKGAEAPVSKSFYTSGYVENSATEVMKPFPQSIYDTVINGSAVEVPTQQNEGKSK